MQIDGGQANLDPRAFGKALGQAIVATGTDPARRKRFIDKAVELGYPRQGIKTKFDALYQRTLKKVHDPSLAGPADKGTPWGRARADAVNGIASAMFVEALRVPSNARVPDAPVNYSYLWNMWQFNFVQYNACVRQPMGRDVAQVIGQPGVLQLFNDAETIELLPGQHRWKSTVRARNLYAIRAVLDTLKPPPWSEAVLGKIDRALRERARAVRRELRAMPRYSRH